MTQFLRGSSRAWRSVTGIVVLALLFFPMDQFSTYLVAGGTSSSFLLITYVLVGLAAVFAVVGTLYSRLRSRPPVPTSATSGAPLPSKEPPHRREEDQDAPEEHQD